jgi:hypothetical protein
VARGLAEADSGGGGGVSRSDRNLGRRPHEEAHETRAELEEALLEALAGGDAERVSRLRQQLEAATDAA